MDIKTLIDRYRAHESLPGPAKVMIQNSLTHQFERDIESLGGNYRFIYALIKKHGSFHPDEVQAFFDKIGVDTIELLDFWLHNFKSVRVSELCNIIDPKLDMADVETTPIQKAIITSLIQEHETTEGWTLHYTDPAFQVISINDLRDVIAKCPSDRFQYIKSIRDCENFSFISLGYLAQIGLGNLACGYCEVHYMKGKEIAYAHALNIAIAHDNDEQKILRVYFIEPQNNDIYLASTPRLAFGIDRMVIRKVLM